MSAAGQEGKKKRKVRAVAQEREDDRPDPATMTFEQATAELETIIDRIERGEIGLEESLKERRRGEALIRRCRSILDTAEQELDEVGEADVRAE